MGFRWILLLLLLLLLLLVVVVTSFQFPQPGAFIIGPSVLKLRIDVHYPIP